MQIGACRNSMPVTILVGMNNQPDSDKRETVTRTVSAVTSNGLIVELLYRAYERRTLFAIGKEGEWRVQDKLMLPSGETLVPFSAGNNLIRNECVLFPSEPEAYDDTSTLVRDIRSYLDRYVVLSEAFHLIAPWYALFSWVHDAFNELPYLRFRGDYGTGKTRALIALGSISYKPIFASAASTPSPIFHILDSFGGTLILDEADFRLSDEKADIVKILNNGNVRGMPVLRTMVSKDREFNPRAFHVFGSKIVAMRKEYDDRALESRFLTEETGHTTLPSDIPINLPESQKEEALTLRNKLLAYRFSELHRVRINQDADWRGNPRLRQATIPLLSIIENGEERTRVRDAIIASYVPPPMRFSERLELDMVTVLVDCLADDGRKNLGLREVAERFNTTHQDQPFCPVTPKWVGTFLRQRLRLITQKSHGAYVIPRTEWQKIKALGERFVQRAA
jgi:hypothetical protein